MSDRNKNIRRKLTDFFRYQQNELTGKERNTFERELQKDSFSEEAADGFASISQGEALKDIENLQKRLKSRTSRRQRITVYRIAASIAVLMVISTVFIFLEKNNTKKHIADNSVQSKSLVIVKDQPITEPVQKYIPSEKVSETAEKKAGRSVTQKIKTKPGKNADHGNIITLAQAQKHDSVSELKAEPNNVSVADKQIAAPANAMSKKFEAKADLQVQGKLDSSVSGLSEVVVVGYGVKRDESVNEDENTGYFPPQPVNGKTDFNNYILKNLHRPDSTASNQRAVVVVIFLVRTDGRIDSIRILRSPGKPFSDEAIRLIKSGPSWKPASENGKPIEDEVRLRIVFR